MVEKRLKGNRKDMEEKIIDTFHALNCPGAFDRRFNLIFTNKRIIGDFVGSNVGGFLAGGLVGMLLTDKHYKNKTLDVDMENEPDKIISRHKKNFYIKYDDVEEALLYKKYVQFNLICDCGIIGDHPAFFFSKEQRDDIESVVMKILPDKTIIKYKKK